MTRHSQPAGARAAPDERPAGRWQALSDRLRHRPAVQLAFRVWNWLWTTVRMLWLCGYATVAALLVLFLFVFNAQGQDLLRISAEQLGTWWNLLFLLGTAALALTLWYSSRLLLGREFDAYPLDLAKAQGRRRWLGRSLRQRKRLLLPLRSQIPRH